MRALPVALTLMEEGRARKHDMDVSNCLTDQAFGLLGRDAVLTVIGLRDAGIGAVILIRDHEYACEDRSVRRIREDLAAAVNLAGETRAMWLMESEG